MVNSRLVCVVLVLACVVLPSALAVSVVNRGRLWSGARERFGMGHRHRVSVRVGDGDDPVQEKAPVPPVLPTKTEVLKDEKEFPPNQPGAQPVPHTLPPPAEKPEPAMGADGKKPDSRFMQLRGDDEGEGEDDAAEEKTGPAAHVTRKKGGEDGDEDGEESGKKGGKSADGEEDEESEEAKEKHVAATNGTVMPRKAFPHDRPSPLRAYLKPPLSSPGRWLHTAVRIGNKMIIFGGVAAYSHKFQNDAWLYDVNQGEWRNEQASYIPPFPASNVVFPKPSGNEFFRPAGLPKAPPLNVEPNAVEDLAAINSANAPDMSGDAPPLPKEVGSPDPSAIKMSANKGIPSAAEMKRMHENENRKRLTQTAQAAFRRSPAGKAKKRKRLREAKAAAAAALKQQKEAEAKRQKEMKAALDAKHKSQVTISTDFRKDKSAEVQVTLKHKGTDITEHKKEGEESGGDHKKEESHEKEEHHNSHHNSHDKSHDKSHGKSHDSKKEGESEHEEKENHHKSKGHHKEKEESEKKKEPDAPPRGARFVQLNAFDGGVDRVHRYHHRSSHHDEEEAEAEEQDESIPHAYTASDRLPSAFSDLFSPNEPITSAASHNPRFKARRSQWMGDFQSFLEWDSVTPSSKRGGSHSPMMKLLKRNRRDVYLSRHSPAQAADFSENEETALFESMSSIQNMNADANAQAAAAAQMQMNNAAATAQAAARAGVSFGAAASVGSAAVAGDGAGAAAADSAKKEDDSDDQVDHAVVQDQENPKFTTPFVGDEVWVYNIDTKLWRLMQKQPKLGAGFPQPRWLHSAVVIEEKMVIFGGVNPDSVILNDVWVYDPDNGNWLESKVEGVPILPREGHSAIVAGTSMIVFGGISYAYSPFNDVWTYMSAQNKWIMNKPKGPKPAPRWMHSAQLWASSSGSRYMVVFGGITHQYVPLNDVWLLALESMTWSQPSLKGIAPFPRMLAASVIVEDSMFIHGGSANNILLEDFFVLDLKDNKWEELMAFSANPFARAGHTMIAVTPPVNPTPYRDNRPDWHPPDNSVPSPKVDKPFPLRPRKEYSKNRFFLLWGGAGNREYINKPEFTPIPDK